MEQGELLLVVQRTELVKLPDREVAWSHTEISYEVEDVRVELVDVHKLCHPRPAELEPAREVGPSLNGSTVE